jgi:hypothetical protein
MPENPGKTSKSSNTNMSRLSRIIITGLAGMGIMVLVGCESIQGVPYNAQTPAAKLYAAEQANATGSQTNAAATPEIQIPVVCSDPAIGRCLSFAPVEVDMQQGDDGSQRLAVMSRVTVSQMIWRVGLIKNGKEIYHFTTASKFDYPDEVIPLEPLALYPKLPIPDKIVVSLVKQNDKPNADQ